MADLWDLVGWHVLNVEIVLQERVSNHSAVVSDSESFGKLSGVLIIEQDVNSVESNLLSGVLPVALVPF